MGLWDKAREEVGTVGTSPAGAVEQSRRRAGQKTKED